MNESIEIWNLLHDGAITVFDDEDKSTLTIFVYIPFIRRKINPAGVSFILKLHGVKNGILQDFDGKEESLSENLDSNTIEILGTESTFMPILLHTTLGNLILEYQSIEYFLDSGDKIDYATIYNSCTEFWEKWHENTKHLGHGKLGH